MPVHKCDNGKYRIGEGKCKYDTKEDAEAAYKAYLAKKHDTKHPHNPGFPSDSERTKHPHRG